MNFGRTLFAQLMEHIPWTTFRRIISKYSGDYRIKTLDCIDVFKIMAFAQLTY